MGREINVESAHGLVMIQGKVSSDETKKTVEGIANGIDGVKSVKNDLQVLPPAKPKMMGDKDEAITLGDRKEPCKEQP